MNVIPCTTWVKRGVAAANPVKVELTPKELEEIIKQTQSELQDNENDSEEESNNATDSTRNEIKQCAESTSDEYDFDKYDEESDNIHCTMKNIASFGADGKDPLVTAGESDVDSEAEDDIIKSDDNLVVLGHVDGDASILEVYVYNEKEGSFYCHHDILLPSFPLCIEWLQYDPADPKPGNLCAIGQMTPIIEIWDLDIIDCLEPAYRLGRKPNKKKRQKRIGHRDAVLDIAWNQNYTHILASGSVDQTVLLWDLENGTPATKLDSFDEKVQSLKWHPTETHQLITGCADKHVRLFDCREQNNVKDWTASGEVERVIWNHFDPNYCIVSTDNGYIECIDTRNDEPLWQVGAHEKEVTGLSISSSCPVLLVSSSNDGVIKAWDLIDNKEPVFLWEKKSNLGALQCLASCPDSPFVFAVGGDNKSKNFQVMDFSEISAVYDRFKTREFRNQKADQNSLARTDTGEEMMDVTEDMESMNLRTNASHRVFNKRERKKK